MDCPPASSNWLKKEVSIRSGLKASSARGCKCRGPTSSAGSSIGPTPGNVLIAYKPGGSFGSPLTNADGPRSESEPEAQAAPVRPRAR